jgi:hypothetical protein
MGIGRRARLRRIKSLLSIFAWLATIGGCTGTSNKPLGVGDDLIVDVDATPAPPDPRDIDEASAADSPFGFLDGPYGILASDAYAPLGACEQCACPSGSYCLGAGTGLNVSSAACGPPVDGGSAAVGVGCVQLPAGCANEPDCPCILNALAGQLSCYPVCVEVEGFSVYCQTP